MTRAERKRAAIAAVRAERIDARRCIDCAAGLQDDDGRRCVECAQRQREAQQRYRRTAHGRVMSAKHSRDRYWRDPETQRENARLRRKLSEIRAEERREGSAA